MNDAFGLVLGHFGEIRLMIFVLGGNALGEFGGNSVGVAGGMLAEIPQKCHANILFKSTTTSYSTNSRFSEFPNNFGGVFLKVCETIWMIFFFWRYFEGFKIKLFEQLLKTITS